MPVRKFPEEVYEYKNSKKSCITTTRFNNKTYEENINHREKNGCIYTCTQPITQSIRPNIDIFVLEMNNETNRIMGIGLIRNEPFYNKYKIHDNDKYNVFSYVGNSHIDRNDMNIKEEQIMRVFDTLCFYNKRHQKRLKGIKCFPIDMLYNCRNSLDLIDFIDMCFKLRKVVL